MRFKADILEQGNPARQRVLFQCQRNRRHAIGKMLLEVFQLLKSLKLLTSEYGLRIATLLNNI